MYKWQITPLRLSIALGIIAASVMGSYLYQRNLAGRARVGVVVTMCLEIVVYGLFIVFSGGFASPYLWYFISASTIILAVGYYNRFFKVAALAALVWYFVCAVAGGRYGLFPGYRDYSDINIGIAFLVVAGGFYILFIYVGRLDESRQQMKMLNRNLQNATERSEQALRHTMDIYESFNLFSVTAPDKVMDEITSLLSRTIAPHGCLLLKTSLLREIESIAAGGLSEDEVEHLLDYFAESGQTAIDESRMRRIEVRGRNYDVFYIHKLSGTQGVLFRLCRQDQNEDSSEQRDKKQENFYLNLVGIILQELDLQYMAEAYVISEEQNRIASEIHDTVIQKLFSIACNLRLLEEKQPKRFATDQEQQLKNIARAVESAMRELREAIYGLRWEAGGQNLFTDKLAVYMDELRYFSGANINISLQGDSQLLTSTQKTIFYRIICEAANNAIHHGKATTVDIQVCVDSGLLQAAIRDNGAGFDLRQVSTAGQGLKNMYRMANMLKGQLFIESTIGQGTAISCSLPR